MSSHHQSKGWVKARDNAKPLLAAEIEQGLGRCVNCHGVIQPGTPLNHWDVGHRQDAATMLAAGYPEHEVNALENLGPSHNKNSGRACNQAAGGRLSQAMSKATKQRDMRRPTW